MTYREEFPDFDPATMPLIPAGWQDISWHNDTCPSFEAGKVHVFIDYADMSRREVQGGGRFLIVRPDDQEVLLIADDWNVVLLFVRGFEDGIEFMKRGSEPCA